MVQHTIYRAAEMKRSTIQKEEQNEQAERSRVPFGPEISWILAQAKKERQCLI
jgi:hypothetical protein